MRHIPRACPQRCPTSRVLADDLDGSVRRPIRSPVRRAASAAPDAGSDPPVATSLQPQPGYTPAPGCYPADQSDSGLECSSRPAAPPRSQLLEVGVECGRPTAERLHRMTDDQIFTPGVKKGFDRLFSDLLRNKTGQVITCSIEEQLSAMPIRFRLFQPAQPFRPRITPHTTPVLPAAPAAPAGYAPSFPSRLECRPADRSQHAAGDDGTTPPCAPEN